MSQNEHVFKGIVLALISNGLFVFVGVLVRMLSESIDVFQVLLFRQIVFILLLTPAIYVSIAVVLKPKLIHLHVLRTLGAFIALYLGYLTVSNLALADATALGFISVLLVALLGRIFLAEQISYFRWMTLLIGLFGVMLVVRPTFSGASAIYIATGVGSALGAAVAVICISGMSKVEAKINVLSYQAVFVGFLAFIPSLYVWQWPTLSEWWLLLAVGVFSSLAQWFGVSAYKFGQANVIANVEYIKIIYSLLFGYWMFSEIADFIAIVGTVILIASALVPVLRQRFI